MKKTDFLKKAAVARLKYEAALELVSADRMNEKDVSGDMSVKDLIAHVTWYEREMVDLMLEMKLAGSDLWDVPGDERNAKISEKNSEKSLSEIQSEAENVYAQLIELLGNLPEGALSDPAHFRDMPPDWVPWEMIAGNTYEHYEEHADDILTWLGN